MAAEARRQVIREAYENPNTGFGNQEETLRQARLQDRRVTKQDVHEFFERLKVREDRPQRGYNSFVPPEPMHQVQVDLADMGTFGSPNYKHMLVAIDSFSKKVAAVPLANKTAAAVANAWTKVAQTLGVPSNVYSDDGTEFKKEFKEKLDFYDIDKIVTRGHAFFVERAIRTLKEGLVRRLSAGVARRNQWHTLLPGAVQRPPALPNVVYDDPVHQPASARPWR